MKRETYRYPAQKKAKLTPAGKTFLDELPVHGELLIFAERSVEVQSETIQPDEVRRSPAGHLIEAGWTGHAKASGFSVLSSHRYGSVMV